MNIKIMAARGTAVATSATRMKRFYLLWLYALTLIAVSVACLQGYFEERRWLADARGRGALLAASLEETLIGHYSAKRFDRIARTIDRLRASNRVEGIAFCASPSPSVGRATRRAQTATAFPRGAGWESLCSGPQARAVLGGADDLDWSSTSGATGAHRYHYFAHRLTPSLVSLWIQDITEARSRWLEAFARAFALTFFGGLIILMLAALQAQRFVTGNVTAFRQVIRSLIAGKRPRLPSVPMPSELQPISRDLNQLAAKVLSMRPREREAPNAMQTILSSLRESMDDRTLVVIANREPYIHQRLAGDGGRIEVLRPASGLVTALEPILRNCGGLWVAHGSGSADFDVTNAQGEVAVPPGNPSYTLRRVRLTQEEEQGYYYGFANEGLWPLCHLAHNRPTFRLSDWEYYQGVNQKFCDALPESVLDERSIILVQDYHYAMAPRMIRDRAVARQAVTGRGRPKVGIFWHIPWPNPEAFGICPWSKELLLGMLGADVIGFHTQYHCNNFLETCNRYLEARIDYERFSVTMGDHETLIQPFPIGIDTTPVRFISDTEVHELKQRYGVVAEKVAVGVDRVDYTKGLIERVESVERFLEKHPEYVGRFSLAQMGSPSRTHIPAYRMLGESFTAAVDRINQRFGHQPGGKNSMGVSVPEGYKPIVIVPHHEWSAIQYFYQMGDTCMVTSLHDGMNLVAKEYIWCQRPERGSLILSKFTGASRELSDAFIVNPYSIEEMADAIHASLELAPEERTRRMLAMRSRVEENSAFHWASNLIRAVISKPADEPELGHGLTLASNVAELAAYGGTRH